VPKDGTTVLLLLITRIKDTEGRRRTRFKAMYDFWIMESVNN